MSGVQTLRTLQDIQDILRENIGLETLPYLDTLQWLPSSGPGATEKLQIGTRDEERVFATFDVTRPAIYQLSILRENSEHEVTDVAKKDMTSVEFFEPFSYWTETTENITKIAQRLRTFLRACFVLRGHAAGGSVIIDMNAFPRVVSVIETTRKRNEKRERSSGHAASTQSVSCGMTGTDQDLTRSSQRPGASLPRRDIMGARGIDGNATNAYATINSIDHSQASRETSSESSEAIEEDIVDLDNGTVNRSRSWNPVNKSSPMQRNGRFGMFSGALLDKRGGQTHGAMRQYPTRTTRPTSKVVRSEQIEGDAASVASEDTVFVTTPHRFNTLPPNTAIDADTVGASLSASHPLGDGVRNSDFGADATPSPSAAPDSRAAQALASPVISSPLFVTGTTPDPSEDWHLFGLLTDAGRACLADSVCPPPNRETCREYAGVNNAIGASQARMASHRHLIIQHETRIAVIEQEKATITAAAEEEESEITQKLTETNHALLSSTTLSNLTAHVEALNKATEKANAAQTKILELRNLLVVRTAELEKQIKYLKKEAKAERKKVQQVQEEIEHTEALKRELEEKGGQGLAVMIGREMERAVKKQRVQ